MYTPTSAPLTFILQAQIQQLSKLRSLKTLRTESERRRIAYRLWASGRDGPGRARGSTELRGRLVEGVETGELSSVPSCFTEPCPELAALIPRGVRGVRGVGTEKRGVAGDGRMPTVVLTEAVVALIWPYSWSVRVLTLGMFLENTLKERKPNQTLSDTDR